MKPLCRRNQWWGLKVLACLSGDHTHGAVSASETVLLTEPVMRSDRADMSFRGSHTWRWICLWDCSFDWTCVFFWLNLWWGVSVLACLSGDWSGGHEAELALVALLRGQRGGRPQRLLLHALPGGFRLHRGYDAPGQASDLRHSVGWVLPQHRQRGVGALRRLPAAELRLLLRFLVPHGLRGLCRAHRLLRSARDRPGEPEVAVLPPEPREVLQERVQLLPDRGQPPSAR